MATDRITVDVSLPISTLANLANYLSQKGLRVSTKAGVLLTTLQSIERSLGLPPLSTGKSLEILEHLGISVNSARISEKKFLDLTSKRFEESLLGETNNLASLLEAEIKKEKGF